MNFLDPQEWGDLEAMEKEYEELTEDLIKELHSRLRPYFLRRVKSDVLQLPPKVSIFGSDCLPKTADSALRMRSLFRYH